MSRDNTSLWKKIPDREYEVSRHGEVWSIRREKMMKTRIVNGYNSVLLCLDTIGSPFRVDKLVAEGFLSIQKDILYHKNKNKLDDRACNLKWLTYEEYFKKIYPGENWKKLENHDGYFISDQGKIWSKFTEDLRNLNMKEGFMSTCLNGKFVHIHVLVAKEFLGHIAGQGVIYHKNGNNLDNHVDNLEIIRKGNMKLKKKQSTIPSRKREKCERPNGGLWPANERYVVTEDGKIYDTKDESFVLQNINKGGYITVSLCHKNYVCHRIVAETYLEKPSENCTQVNHIDGNKQNNHVSNLEWVTMGQNISHSINVLHKEKMITSKQKPVISTDEDGNEKEYPGVKAAWRETGINSGSITGACKGKTKHAGGLKWRYK
jgi:hypothetical protein